MLLTKQDKQILYKLYSEYLNRRKTGLSISNPATLFPEDLSMKISSLKCLMRI